MIHGTGSSPSSNKILFWIPFPEIFGKTPPELIVDFVVWHFLGRGRQRPNLWNKEDLGSNDILVGKADKGMPSPFDYSKVVVIMDYKKIKKLSEIMPLLFTTEMDNYPHERMAIVFLFSPARRGDPFIETERPIYDITLEPDVRSNLGRDVKTFSFYFYAYTERGMQKEFRVFDQIGSIERLLHLLFGRSYDTRYISYTSDNERDFKKRGGRIGYSSPRTSKSGIVYFEQDKSLFEQRRTTYTSKGLKIRILLKGDIGMLDVDDTAINPKETTLLGLVSQYNELVGVKESKCAIRINDVPLERWAEQKGLKPKFKGGWIGDYDTKFYNAMMDKTLAELQIPNNSVITWCFKPDEPLRAIRPEKRPLSILPAEEVVPEQELPESEKELFEPESEKELFEPEEEFIPPSSSKRKFVLFEEEEPPVAPGKILPPSRTEYVPPAEQIEIITTEPMETLPHPTRETLIPGWGMDGWVSWESFRNFLLSKADFLDRLQQSTFGFYRDQVLAVLKIMDFDGIREVIQEMAAAFNRIHRSTRDPELEKTLSVTMRELGFIPISLVDTVTDLGMRIRHLLRELVEVIPYEHVKVYLDRSLRLDSDLYGFNLTPNNVNFDHFIDLESSYADELAELATENENLKMQERNEIRKLRPKFEELFSSTKGMPNEADMLQFGIDNHDLDLESLSVINLSNLRREYAMRISEIDEYIRGVEKEAARLEAEAQEEAARLKAEALRRQQEAAIPEAEALRSQQELDKEAANVNFDDLFGEPQSLVEPPLVEPSAPQPPLAEPESEMQIVSQPPPSRGFNFRGGRCKEHWTLEDVFLPAELGSYQLKIFQRLLRGHDDDPLNPIDTRILLRSDKQRESIEMDIVRPLLLKQRFPQHPAFSDMRGLLITGPPGSGKTTLARQLIQTSLKNAYPNHIEVTAYDLIGGLEGETEKAIQMLYRFAKVHQPCIIFIDDIDNLLGSGPVMEGDVMSSVRYHSSTEFQAQMDLFENERILLIATTTEPLRGAMQRRMFYIHHLDALTTSDVWNAMRLKAQEWYALPIESLPDPSCFVSANCQVPGFAHVLWLNLFPIQSTKLPDYARAEQLLASIIIDTMSRQGILSNNINDHLRNNPVEMVSGRFHNFLTLDDVKQSIANFWEQGRARLFRPSQTHPKEGSIDTQSEETLQFVVENLDKTVTTPERPLYGDGFSAIQMGERFLRQNTFVTANVAREINKKILIPFEMTLIAQVIARAAREQGLEKEFHIPTKQFLLLHGPAGTGKTELSKLLAEKLAEMIWNTDGDVKVFTVTSADVVHSEVGMTEKAITLLFEQQIREFLRASPKNYCIVKMDEMDAIFGTRGQTYELTRSRLFVSLMRNMSNTNLLVIGTTNYREKLWEGLRSYADEQAQFFIDLPDNEMLAKAAQMAMAEYTDVPIDLVYLKSLFQHSVQQVSETMNLLRENLSVNLQNQENISTRLAETTNLEEWHQLNRQFNLLVNEHTEIKTQLQLTERSSLLDVRLSIRAVFEIVRRAVLWTVRGPQIHGADIKSELSQLGHVRIDVDRQNTEIVRLILENIPAVRAAYISETASGQSTKDFVQDIQSKLDGALIKYFTPNDYPFKDWDIPSQLMVQASIRSKLRSDVLLPYASRFNMRTDTKFLPHGLLFYGPPGTGKTVLVNTLINYLSRTMIYPSVNMKVLNVTGGTIAQGYVGFAERVVRAIFDRAEEFTKDHPERLFIIVINEIDSVLAGANRENSRLMFQTKMTDILSYNVLLIGTTNLSTDQVETNRNLEDPDRYWTAPILERFNVKLLVGFFNESDMVQYLWNLGRNLYKIPDYVIPIIGNPIVQEHQRLLMSNSGLSIADAKSMFAARFRRLLVEKYFNSLQSNSIESLFPGTQLTIF